VIWSCTFNTRIRSNIFMLVVLQSSMKGIISAMFIEGGNVTYGMTLDYLAELSHVLMPVSSLVAKKSSNFPYSSIG